MKIAEGEFLIVTNIGTSIRPRLVKFLEQGDDKECKGFVEVPSKEEDSKLVSFSAKDVVANLGKFPRAGSVFGVKIEPLLKTIKDKRFGEIRFYQRMKTERHEQFMEELDVFWKSIKGKGHTGFKYHIEVRNAQGKYAGYYKSLPKADQDILCVKPESIQDLQYVFHHEHAHGLWFNRCNSRTFHKWIALYHHYVTISEAPEDILNQILEEILAAGSVDDFFKAADDEQKSIIKACLRYVKQVHGLSKSHLNTALSISETIADYWPVSSLDFSEKDIAISDYSRKSPEEFFAEAYSFWALGRPLPKKVASLLDGTLSRLTN